MKHKYAKVALLSLSLVLFQATNSYGHSGLISSSPKPGAVLKKLPKTIQLKFNEKLLVIEKKTINTIIVMGPSGKIAEGIPQVSGSQISINLMGSSEVGTYKVVWRVVSEDGHPVKGSFKFKIN